MLNLSCHLWYFARAAFYKFVVAHSKSSTSITSEPVEVSFEYNSHCPLGETERLTCVGFSAARTFVMGPFGKW